eukprot:4521931-Lingulodinium_polyedra.AAC.1
MRAPVRWRARGVRERVICEPLRRRAVDSTASLCGVFKRYIAMRSNRPSAVAAVRKSRAGALHARANKLVRAWSARA